MLPSRSFESPCPAAARRNGPWSWLGAACLWLLLSIAGACLAQQPDDTDKLLDNARKQIDGLQRQIADPALAAASLPLLRSQALAVQAQTAKVADDLAPQLTNVQARQAELGPAPTAPATEAPDVAAQRSRLKSANQQLDAQLRLARLLAIEGAQAAEQIVQVRRSRFEARLGERTPSILALPFWQELRDSWPDDKQRLQQLGATVAGAARNAGAWTWLGIVASIAAALALLPWLSRLWLKMVSTRVPAGRLRRSLLALGLVALPTGVALWIGAALRLGLTSSAATPAVVESLCSAFAGAMALGVYVAALGRVLLSPRRPSWRLTAVPDAVAERLRHDPLWLGMGITGSLWAERLAALVNTDLSTSVAINCVFSLLLSWLLARGVRRGEKLQHALTKAPQGAPAPPRPLWLIALATLAWALLVVSSVCLLLGYVALGSFVVRQVAWFAIVGASLYLLAAFIDDACTTWLGASRPDADEQDDTDASAIAPPALRRQAAVLLSAACRVVLALIAVVMVLAPFGQGPAELLQRASSLTDGIAVGEIHVAPGALVQGLAILVFGTMAVRLLQRWLLERYLPTTSLDAGMRISAATLLGYVGMVFAVALALSAVGLGLERIAWVASALSVGIGFGLQAVVQNFVSGLILLTERPVKVGDWVALGGIEGDIRRINVRATEIQMGDRSTVIVPNSEFITKTVRNVTHANPLGLVQIKLPMPLDTDAERVRTLLLAAFTEHADVLSSPAPGVSLDGIDGGSLVFNATGSVSSPRRAYDVKSELLFDILVRLKTAGLAMSKPATMVLRETPAAS